MGGRNNRTLLIASQHGWTKETNGDPLLDVWTRGDTEVTVVHDKSGSIDHWTVFRDGRATYIDRDKNKRSRLDAFLGAEGRVIDEHRIEIETGAFGGAAGLVRAQCTCRSYTSSWGTENEARRAWGDHWAGKIRMS